MPSMENPEINNYARLSIMSEASINRYNNAIRQALKESIKTCINFYRYLTCLIHFRMNITKMGQIMHFSESWRIIEMLSSAAIHLIILRLQTTVEELQIMQDVLEVSI